MPLLPKIRYRNRSGFYKDRSPLLTYSIKRDRFLNRLLFPNAKHCLHIQQVHSFTRWSSVLYPAYKSSLQVSFFGVCRPRSRLGFHEHGRSSPDVVYLAGTILDSAETSDPNSLSSAAADQKRKCHRHFARRYFPRSSTVAHVSTSA